MDSEEQNDKLTALQDLEKLDLHVSNFENGQSRNFNYTKYTRSDPVTGNAYYPLDNLKKNYTKYIEAPKNDNKESGRSGISKTHVEEMRSPKMNYKLLDAQTATTKADTKNSNFS